MGRRLPRYIGHCVACYAGKDHLRWKATVDGARQRQGLDPALLHNQLVEKVTVKRLVHGREHERYRRTPNIPPWRRCNG